ncbi:flagellar biosynthesis protein FlhB [Acidocella sp.]|uniref:EscU/YscU/HrcU family type III secretion system export apparatus switch protein n=1 Tax=Acidocella sp. TaxID=50710 RepID=UPI002610AD2B|nr:flagellar type III secretion system protein FlhB [Acidocella sp.]
MADSSGDKKHAPTERRLHEAAQCGDVGRSGELPKAAAVVLTTLFALSAAAGIGTRLLGYFATMLANAGTAPVASGMGWGMAVIAALWPLLALVAAISTGATLLTGGFVFSLSLLRLDFSKLMPQAGLGQVFSKSGFSETGKALLKFAAIGGVGAYAIWSREASFVALARLPHPGFGPVIGLTLQVITAICLVLVVLAGGDAGLQFWLHRQKLRMSDHEIREEMKDSAGNPHVKSRQRGLARKMARARQMSKIPEASVIVTNPTHYACAIRYSRGADTAPMLLAKGVGLVAGEIIAKGRGLGIPIVEAPPLARAVYRHVEPGEHVPVALYRACAEVLAYVWKMQRWRSQGGARPKPPPVRQGEIEISRWTPAER